MNKKEYKLAKNIKVIVSFIIILILLGAAFLYAVNTGSISLGLGRIARGLFVEYDREVAAVYDLRFPRIIITMLAGGGVAVSGVLFQAVLKNPLADPGIIGISVGAGFMAAVITIFVPSLYFMLPVFAFLGAVAAFLLVYVLSWRNGLSPLRIILTGVAVSAFFGGFTSSIGTMTGGDRTGVASVVLGNVTQKTWDDVIMAAPYILAGLVLSVFLFRRCNLLALEDKTAGSLGINVNRTRIIISSVACVLAGVSAAIAGNISFLGLVVPHMGRIIVGSDHKKLIPYTALAGAVVYLIADTAGRTIAMPYEIPASVIMNVVGGPFFIILLRRSGR